MHILPDEFVGKRFSDFMNDERYKDTVSFVVYYDKQLQRFVAYLRDYGTESGLNKVIEHAEGYVVVVK